MLMFICIPESYDRILKTVSIHPMLMFIAEIAGSTVLQIKRFNTSYVNVYQDQQPRQQKINTGFNTSYVNVYPLVLISTYGTKDVSIHPMLMFIQRISAISKNNYTNFSSIYQLFSIFYQPIPHFIVFK